MVGNSYGTVIPIVPAMPFHVLEILSVMLMFLRRDVINTTDCDTALSPAVPPGAESCLMRAALAKPSPLSPSRVWCRADVNLKGAL